MEGKSSFFNIVLLVIVALLTLSLAALAGYVFIGGGQKQSVVIQQVDTTIPADDELVSLKLYEGKPKYYNLKVENSASNVLPVIQISVELKYFKKAPKKSTIKDTTAKITAYEGEIKELIGTYFMNLSLNEVKKADAKEKAAEELKKQINELINKNEEVKKDVIYKIAFEEWFFT